MSVLSVSSLPGSPRSAAPNGEPQPEDMPAPESFSLGPSLVQEHSELGRVPGGFVPLSDPVPVVNISTPDNGRRAEQAPQLFMLADGDQFPIDVDAAPYPGATASPLPSVAEVYYGPVFPLVEEARPAAPAPASGGATAPPGADRRSEQSWLQAAWTSVLNSVQNFLPVALLPTEAPAPSPGPQDAPRAGGYPHSSTPGEGVVGRSSQHVCHLCCGRLDRGCPFGVTHCILLGRRRRSCRVVDASNCPRRRDCVRDHGFGAQFRP